MVNSKTLARISPHHTPRLAVWLAGGVTMRTRKAFATISLALRRSASSAGQTDVHEVALLQSDGSTRR